MFRTPGDVRRCVSMEMTNERAAPRDSAVFGDRSALSFVYAVCVRVGPVCVACRGVCVPIDSSGVCVAEDWPRRANKDGNSEYCGMQLAWRRAINAAGAQF